LRDRLFREGQAGTRCLLDEPIVRDAVSAIREELAEAKLMPTNSPAIQAIAFDKSPSANWKVTWHQDLMFPFARPATRPGFDLQSKKDGVDYARPPTAILEELLAVRLHLDDCGVSNGPLRVSPGTHNLGVLRRAEVQGCVAKNGEVVCVANEGNALIMRPLLLHASSPAIEPRHRRVLHIVFYSGMPISEQWFREV
ncbi:MAG TPA: phytanoyl-CoA dioxygenase family protein, partial [Opitutaceae bacterium]|nr:phytanoyl-CoA dioxygenase family protein [Opitutaceae bacterium]